MLSANERITPRQFQILFLVEALAVGLLVLPWLSGVWGILIVVPGVCLAFFAAALAKRRICTPLALLFILKILVCTGLLLRVFGGVIQAVLLERTPLFVVFALVLGVAAYAAAKGIETRARLAEILILLIVPAFVVMGFVGAPEIELRFIAMDFDAEWLGLLVFLGTPSVWLAVPFLNKPEEGRGAAVSVMALFCVVLAGFALFASATRLDFFRSVPFVGVWLLSVFAYLAGGVFYGAVLGRGVVKRGGHERWVVGSAASVFIVALAFLFLGGCWDGVEIEERVFAVAIGIDAAEEGVSFSIARARLETGDDEDCAEPPTTGQNLYEAIQKMDARSSRKLTLGQAKAVVFGTALLEDAELFREVVKTLENNREIDRTIAVLAADSDYLAEVLNARPPGEAKSGYYVVNAEKLARKSGGKAKDLKAVLADLKAGGETVLPLVVWEDGHVLVDYTP